MGDPLTVEEPFTDARQQREAKVMGMFLFLATEAMLFGGLFVSLLVSRLEHPGAAAEAAGHLKLWLATGNTALLLTSSLFVALGVHAARQGDRGGLVKGFLAGLLLGAVFLVLKAVEYALDAWEGLMPGVGPPSPLRDGPAALILDLYFAGTALHAFHMLVGLGLLGWIAARAQIGALPLPGRRTTPELAGLYWHFVDVVWAFLFAVFYLPRG